MMVRVNNAREAAQAASAGVDLIEVSFEAMPPEATSARAIRTAFPGALRLRVEHDRSVRDAVTWASTIQADEIALPLDGALALCSELPEKIAVVARWRPAPRLPDSIERGDRRVRAVMLEPDGGTRLFEQAGIAQLDAFATACREHRLVFGFGGGLEAPDIARLLLLDPDVLAFDTATREGHRMAGPIDPAALDTIRALIPRVGGTPPASGPIHRTVVDRVFVRDFVVPLSIGAYQAERDARQRVRFSAEVEVSREPSVPRDMRDVFSYDIIIETIRVLAERTHVAFVETLAEEVAAALLAQPAVLALTVKVEKLDVIDGAVGIEIHRRRPH